VIKIKVAEKVQHT